MKLPEPKQKRSCCCKCITTIFVLILVIAVLLGVATGLWYFDKVNLRTIVAQRHSLNLPQYEPPANQTEPNYAIIQSIDDECPEDENCQNDSN